jgi:MFS family permease
MEFPAHSRVYSEENEPMSTQAPRASANSTISEAKVLLLASVGSAFEFYDFVIYVFFASIIGKLFFPSSLADWSRQLQSYTIFAAGYIVRPLGGIVMAHFGDTRGRKHVFTLSLLLMALPTLSIGLLPTYTTIGIAAPILLLAMRLLQGMAIGGEAPGAWVFVAEHAKTGRAGFAVGLLTCGLCGGILLGSLVSIGMGLSFDSQQIAAGVWRVPFLIGGIFGLCSAMLRKWFSETEAFRQMHLYAEIARELPLRVVLRGHKRAVLSCIFATLLLTAAIVVVILMTPSLLEKTFSIPPAQVQFANLAGIAALCISTVVIGIMADRFCVRKVAVPMALLLTASTYALYLCAGRAPSALLPLYVLAGLGAGVTTLVPIVMVRAFPPMVRFTGVAFSYNFAYAVFGGITPVVASTLAHIAPLGPAHFIAVASAVSVLAIVLAPTAFDSTHEKPKAKYQEELLRVTTLGATGGR